jgi:hypothetical protein
MTRLLVGRRAARRSRDSGGGARRDPGERRGRDVRVRRRTWNFVNNQTDGAAAGTLTVFFDTEEFGVIQFGPVGPTVATKNVQKFTLFTNNRATLVSASTNLPGKLVLESVGCAPFA